MSLFTKVKKAIGSLLFAGLIANAALPMTAGASVGPVFNSHDGDKELFRGTNVTKQETSWHDPVTGDAGDVFAGLIYYHNGIENTVAENTKIKVSIPSATTNQKAVLNATISADNAASVSDTLTVDLDENARVELIPGSVVWYPNQNQQPGVSSDLLYHQTGDEIISAGGLNLGPIDGCWSFAGFVMFKFKTVKIGQPKIEKSKIAENLTTESRGVEISAKPGEEVKYILTTKNTGTESANAFVVSDDLSDILEYANITAISDGGTVGNGVISWPAVNIAAGESLNKSFTVKVKNPLPTTPESGYHFDFVMYNVYGNQVIVRLPRPEVKQEAVIEKTVRNFTTSEINFVDQNEANAGDTLEYKVYFKNTGDSNLDNVLIIDSLPANVSYLTGSTLLSQNGGEERSYIDGITKDGLRINLPAGTSGYFRFKVITSTSIAGGEILTNTGSLKFGDKTISDTAKTKIKEKVKPQPQPELPVTGGENIIISGLLSMSLGVFGVYRRYKKRLDQLVK